MQLSQHKHAAAATIGMPSTANKPSLLRVHGASAPADKKLTVAVVGGSISAGTGAEDAPAWVDRLETYLKETYGKVANVNVTVNNGAVPGTTSAYMSGCVNLHVPADADIVVVEYTVNDDQLALPVMDNPVRCVLIGSIGSCVIT
jgi:lysophospholipase L1-like esterase